MTKIKKIKKITYIKNDFVYSTNVDRYENYITEDGSVNKNCVVDQYYDGEIIVNLHNPKLTPEVVEPGAKIAQFILAPVPECEIVEVDESEVLNQGSKRGEGGFGSTDKK